MSWTKIIIVAIFLQSLFITGIDGNAKRRRYRRQTSGSLYGTNANLGASAPAGYNYPANTNIKGIRLNNPDARDLYGNSLISSSNAEGSLSSVDFYNQPRPQQQQLYGTNDQSSLNRLYSGSSFYSGSGTNQLIRDSNGNLLPAGSLGNSFYSSSNNQMAYPANPNQVLANKDLYGTSPNTNNNPYGYNSNQLPNSNTYGGPMGTNNNLLPNSNSYSGSYGSNTNLLPNSNTYSGSYGNNANSIPNSNSYSGSYGNNANLVPNSNAYSGYTGTNDNNNNNNYWSNANTYNRQNQNAGNMGYPNRDTNYNSNNNRYSNPNSYYYSHSDQLTTSFSIIILSVITAIISHL